MPPCPDEGSRGLRAPRVAVGEVHVGDHPRRARRIAHEPGVGEGRGERLFAQHGAPARDRRQGDGRVHDIHGDHGHRVELLAPQQLVVIGIPARYAPRAGKGARLLLVDIAAGREGDAADRREALRMRGGHEPGADDAKPYHEITVRPGTSGGQLESVPPYRELPAACLRPASRGRTFPRCR